MLGLSPGSGRWSESGLLDGKPVKIAGESQTGESKAREEAAPSYSVN
jgi:hypothetical protein